MFYGWWVIAASAICLALSWPVIAIYNFGPFVIPLSNEFGWSRGEISAAILVINGTATVIALVLGVLVDYAGAKRVMLPSIVLLAMTIFSMYWLSDSLVHFYIMFFLIALLGAGTSTLTFSRVVFNWFDRRRGLAIGLTMAGVGIGATVLPLVTTLIISSLGWRVAYLFIGAGILIISGSACYFVLREYPAQMGLHKDGRAMDQEKSDSGPIESGYTFRQALSTRPFWLLLLSFFLVGFCVIACTVHLVPMMQDRGISPTVAAQTASVLGFAIILGRVFAGYLMDHFFAPYVAIGFMLGPALGLSLLALELVGMPAYLAALLIGLALGAEFDFLAYFTSRYGGLKAYGIYFGVLLASFNLGSSIGPYVMGLGFDRTGAYTTFLWGFAVCFLFICFLFLLLGPYPQFSETDT